MLEIRLLGKFDLQQDGAWVELSSRPARALLAYLVLTRGTHHPRERLAGLLWPDSSESNARKNLRQALWQLRKAIGEPHLLVDTASIAFNVSSDFWLDVAVLDDAGDQDLVATVSVYEGELLPGFYEDWVLLERDRLDAAYERKMQRLVAQLEQEQRWSEVLEWAERWIAQGHVPEAGYRSLMMAHAAMGELSKVEATYQRCTDALQQEVGVEPSEETIALYKSLVAGERILREPTMETPGETALAAAQRVNLPTQPTPFIGRKGELAEIEQLLSTTRLLTLTGPGGIGKTRLAITAAAEVANEFEHGCFYVSLAPIRAVEHLIQRIAEALKYPLATHEDPQLQLLRYLRERQLLLVMDNFEHLLDGVYIVNEILQSAPEVKILATSQEKLNLHSETNLIVGGMGFPGRVEAEEAGEYDAIALFVQSARKSRPGFDPSPDDLEQIAKICQIVGGMPLAIELAAAWLHVLNVDEIAMELEKGLDILETELRDAPERHRSIRAVFDHSWFLLGPTERETFLRLSVFRGGYSREAAQEVAGASLHVLAELVNKSFINHDPSSARFEVHELLRQYAQELLGETPEARTSAQDAHAAYYATFVQQREELLTGKRQKLVLAEIEADIENVRAAWRYYLDQKNVSPMWKFIRGIWHIYWIRWWTHAGMELFAEAVEALQGEKGVDAVALRAYAMALQGIFMAWLGLAEGGYGLAKESVEILQQQDRPEALAFAFESVVVNAYFLGRLTEEVETLRKELESATEMDDKWLMGFALFGLSMTALIEEDYAEAMRLAEWSLKLNEEIGDISGLTMPLIVMGHVAFARDEYEQAREYYLRSLKIAEDVGFNFSIQNASKYLGKLAVSLGDYAEAEKYLRQSLRVSNEIGFIRDVVNLLFEYARLRVAQGNVEQAVELLSLVVQHPASDQNRLFEGSIRDSAKDLLAGLEDELPQETYKAAFERGQELELADVLTALLKANYS
ncbi:MAG: tetratricopeptide repeat protein [Anaerolineales bacterium]|nr:tetratricopeptide repeat protein [Anaerolineales bacterium]